VADLVNIANAILILGTMYFGYTYGFNVGHFLLIIFSLLMWSYPGFEEEKKQLLDAKIRLYNAKADHYERKQRRG